MAQFHGIVKSVLSGDSLIIMGLDASKGPPPEKLLSLSGITSPRLGNPNMADMPFSWGAREFLRKLAIGKKCSFMVDAVAPPQPGQKTREFGTVIIDNINVAYAVVEAGWAKVKPGQPEELVAAGAMAEAAGVGIFGPAAGAVRTVQWAKDVNIAELVKQVKGTPMAAVVEQVPSGSAMRLMLLPDFIQVTVILAGIQCPQIKRDPTTGEEKAEPFSREARYYVECRLLNRDVTVKLEGLDKNGTTAFGTVLCPQGNMSVQLVANGFARVVDYSAQLTENAAELRATERAAKQKRLRIWHDYVPPNAGAGMGEAQVKVVEVVSGDTIVVTDIGGGGERRWSISSIKAPRVLKENSEPYALEAKEFLRKTLIGKKVRLVPEFRTSYVQEKTNTEVTRQFASVFLGDKNVASSLVEAGLVEVDKRGGGERSEHYDALLEAEEAAAKGKKGKHGGPPKSGSKPTDLTTPAAKERAKSYLRGLEREGRVRATVQFVVNGARFKLTLPKENLLVTFSLVGLRCPACARRDGGDAGEPFGDEAMALTRGLTFQRDVEIEVEAVDKGGCFLGSLFLPDKRNLGIVLLQGGLASRFGPAADRSTYGEEMWKVEEAAKAANLKIWEGYSAEKEAAEKAAAEAAAAAEEDATPDTQKQVVSLLLTEILDGAHFFAHLATDETDALSSLQAKLAATRVGGGYEPSNGAVVAAKFTQDDLWYRAKVTKKEKGSYTVFFVDYGNSDVVTKERLAPLDPTLNLMTVSAQAMECRLACTTVPEGEDGDAAVDALGQDAWGKPVMARVDDRQGGVLHVTLLDAAGGSINEKLIESGLARAEKKPLKRHAALAASLMKKEAAAKTSRAGMWRYGDIDEDDAKEFGFQRPPPAPAPAKGAWGKK